MTWLIPQYYLDHRLGFGDLCASNVVFGADLDNIAHLLVRRMELNLYFWKFVFGRHKLKRIFGFGAFFELDKPISDRSRRCLANKSTNEDEEEDDDYSGFSCNQQKMTDWDRRTPLEDVKPISRLRTKEKK